LLTSLWHSPSNAHAYRLYVFKELRRCGAADFRSAKRWDYAMFCKTLSSTLLVSFFAALRFATVVAHRVKHCEAHDYSTVF
jgi:hypothetical protein